MFVFAPTSTSSFSFVITDWKAFTTSSAASQGEDSSSAYTHTHNPNQGLPPKSKLMDSVE